MIAIAVTFRSLTWLVAIVKVYVCLVLDFDMLVAIVKVYVCLVLDFDMLLFDVSYVWSEL